MWLTIDTDSHPNLVDGLKNPVFHSEGKNCWWDWREQDTVFPGFGKNNFELLEQHSAYDRSLFSHYVQQSNDIAGFKKTKPQELSIL